MTTPQDLVKAVASFASQYFGERELIRPIVSNDQREKQGDAEPKNTRPSQSAQASTSRRPTTDPAEENRDQDEDNVERALAAERKPASTSKFIENQRYQARLKARRAALAPEAQALEQKARNEHSRVYRLVAKARKLIRALQNEVKELSATKGMEVELQSAQERLVETTQELQNLQRQAKEAKRKINEIMQEVPPESVANIAEAARVDTEDSDIDTGAEQTELNMLNRMDSSALVALGELRRPFVCAGAMLNARASSYLRRRMCRSAYSSEGCCRRYQCRFAVVHLRNSGLSPCRMGAKRILLRARRQF